MQSLTIKSYAKLNIGLKVLDTLPDGYHAICTIMHEIDFYDLITIKKNTKNKIKLECVGNIEVPNDFNNLCVQAAQLFFDSYNIYDIGIDIKQCK